MSHGYDGRDGEREHQVFDLYPVEPRGDVPWRMRQAQVVQTFTETAGDPYGATRGRRGPGDDASPRLRTITANVVAVAHAALLLALNVAGAAITLTLLVRILEWLS